MRLFGFDIVKCSKAQKQELDTYKCVVQELNDRLVQFLDFIANLISIEDPESIDEEACVQLLFEQVETICKLIILYDSNRFAIPITNLSMLQRMNELREHAGMLQSAMIHHVSMLSNREQENDDDEDEETTIRYDNMDRHYYSSIRHMEKIVFADINRIISVIQYDLFRIIFGVDILRDYQKRQKRIKGKPNFEVKVFNHFESNKSNGGN